jgi:uncharacterized PurR-regulated membrane protein YhhQ (DUF165 family)
MSDHTAPTSTTAPGAAELAATLLLGLLLGGGPTLLAYLSRFGPTPVLQLPLLAVALFGVLFVGSLYDLCWRLDRRRLATRLALLGAASVAAVAATTVSPLGDWRYLLAPATALLLGAALLGGRRRRRAGLYAAGLVYIGATLLANFTLDSFLPVGQFFLVNVGTLFFGLTFTQRDRIHRYGRRAVYSMILAAAVTNVVLAASLGTPHRFVIVSFVTILIAEAADTEVYQRLLRRRWLVRVASSNAVSAPLDTVLFTLLAFWGQPYATAGWLMQVMVTDILVKYASGILAALGMLALLRTAWPQARAGDAPPLESPERPPPC